MRKLSVLLALCLLVGAVFSVFAEDLENDITSEAVELAVPEEEVALGGEDEEDAGLKWIDEDWKDDYTNRLPYAVKATLYMKPAERGDKPVALRRLITIPVAPLSWRDKGAAGGSKETTGNGEKKKEKEKNENEKKGEKGEI